MGHCKEKQAWVHPDDPICPHATILPMNSRKDPKLCRHCYRHVEHKEDD